MSLSSHTPSPHDPKRDKPLRKGQEEGIKLPALQKITLAQSTHDLLAIEVHNPKLECLSDLFTSIGVPLSVEFLRKTLGVLENDTQRLCGAELGRAFAFDDSFEIGEVRTVISDGSKLPNTSREVYIRYDSETEEEEDGHQVKLTVKLVDSSKGKVPSFVIEFDPGECIPGAVDYRWRMLRQSAAFLDETLVEEFSEDAQGITLSSIRGVEGSGGALSVGSVKFSFALRPIIEEALFGEVDTSEAGEDVDDFASIPKLIESGEASEINSELSNDSFVDVDLVDLDAFTLQKLCALSGMKGELGFFFQHLVS